MYPQPLSDLIAAAAVRLQADLESAAPFMAGQVSAWARQLAGGAAPADYFEHPSAFPSLLLPWWLEKSLRAAPDLAFQADLAYSTINGYYYIRLLDNLMDGQATVELQLLPAAGFFHTQFQAAYQRYFEHGHPFWNFFKRIWFFAAEATVRDANLADWTAEQFRTVAAQKVCAAKIPLAAVAYRYDRPEVVEPWTALCDALGGWHQMWNDVFGWHKDVNLGLQTYFLAEARRRQRPGEAVAAWVAREGFAWGAESLQDWLAELKRQAAALNCPDLEAYVQQREAAFHRRCTEAQAGLRPLAALAALLD